MFQNTMFPRIRVFSEQSLTITETETVKRPWRERLLSWPWYPWLPTKLRVTKRPDPNIIIVGGHDIIMHPVIYEYLSAHMAIIAGEITKEIENVKAPDLSNYVLEERFVLVRPRRVNVPYLVAGLLLMMVIITVIAAWM